MVWFAVRRRAFRIGDCRALLVAAAWTGADLAYGPARAANKVTTIEGFSEYRLDNGLQVLLCPDDSKPTVTVNLTVFVGSRHEGYGETGMAHLLEHMLFKGTPDQPARFPKRCKSAEPSSTAPPGSTAPTITRRCRPRTKISNSRLALEADRMINSNVSHEDLISEMTVVRNEFERGENSPGMLLYQRLLAMAYEWHNYGKVTIGNRTDIERVPIERLQAVLRQVLSARQRDAGGGRQVRRGEDAGTDRQIFRPDSQADAQARPHLHRGTAAGRRAARSCFAASAMLGLVGAVYHIPAGSHPDMAALDILTEVLGNAPSGRLYKSLVETKKATSIRSTPAVGTIRACSS